MNDNSINLQFLSFAAKTRQFLAEMLMAIFARHRFFWTKEKIFLARDGVLFFLFALLFQRYAYNYIDYKISTVPVGDLLLDNLPSVNLSLFIVQGALVSTFIVALFLLAKPKYVPFSVKALALFLIIRSFFISLTHLGVNPDETAFNENGLGFWLYDFLYNGKNDFFFSGHVGAAFLFALIFWKEKNWRYLFLAITFVFGASMLLSHRHYSIDVFAAPFITYGIFTLAKNFFKKDFNLIK